MRTQAFVCAALAATLVVTATPAFAQGRARGVWQLDSTASAVMFHARHFLLSTVTGRFTGFSGSVSGTAPDFSDAVVTGRVPLRSVRTGDDERDSDLLKPPFFDAGTHPLALFASSSVRHTGPNRWTMAGELTMRGVTQPVSFAVRREIDADGRATFVAEAEIDRFAWGLRWNRLVEGGGVVVDRMVRIELRAVLISDAD